MSRHCVHIIHFLQKRGHTSCFCKYLGVRLDLGAAEGESEGGVGGVGEGEEDGAAARLLSRLQGLHGSLRSSAAAAESFGAAMSNLFYKKSSVSIHRSAGYLSQLRKNTFPLVASQLSPRCFHRRIMPCALLHRLFGHSS